MHAYRTSYDILQTLTVNNACHIEQGTISFRYQPRTMHVLSDKLQCPSDTNAEQCISFRTSYDVLQTLAQNNACHIGQNKMSFRHKHRTMHVIPDKLRWPFDSNTVQCMSYRTSYDVLQTLAQNNAFISDKLQCPSDTNTEQCMSYRTSYDVLQKRTQNNACHIGQATMSFI